MGDEWYPLGPMRQYLATLLSDWNPKTALTGTFAAPYKWSVGRNRRMAGAFRFREPRCGVPTLTAVHRCLWRAIRGWIPVVWWPACESEHRSYEV